LKVRSERRFAALVIDRWMTYLEQRVDIPCDDIAIYGVGMGAAFATEAATLDLRFKAVVCDGGQSDLMVRAGSLNEALDSDIDDAIGLYAHRLNDHSLLKQLTCPVLMTRGDDAWPGAMRISTANASYDAALAERKLSDCSPVSPPILHERIFDWLSDQLTHAQRP
jgi:dienelactone hydrolase